MGQVFSHQPLTAKASFWCWANPCEMCGWQRCTETGSPNTQYFGFLVPLSNHLCSIFFNGLTDLFQPRSPHYWGSTLILSQSTPNLAGLFHMSDQAIAETSTWLYTTLKTDRHQCPWQDSNLQSQNASGRRLTP